MTLQQMKYLINVAGCGSISEAAKRLYVAQSSISNAVKEIELEYGVVVFDRSRKGVSLTREGEELMVELRKIVERMEYLDKKFRSKRETKRFNVSASHHIVGLKPFAELINGFSDCRYYVGYLECRTQQILENVETGISDLGLLFYAETSKDIMMQQLEEKGLAYHRLSVQKPCVIISREHPLAAKDSVVREELPAFPFISYDTGPNTSNILTSFVELEGMSIICVSDRASAYSLLTETEAFLIGTGGCADDALFEGIVVRPIGDAPDIEIGWISKRNTVLSHLAGRFVGLLATSLG